MGFRNPFRMSVDKATGVVYVGDYGPDAGSTDANRGPSGQVEFNRVTSAGNYGWPYCTGTNTSTETYNEWNFATGATGAKYNCAGGPTNNSFRNTGQGTLPAARPAWIRYAGDAGTPPEFGGGSESPMGGPVYRYNASQPVDDEVPAGFDGQFFATEFGRGWIKPIHVNADGTPRRDRRLPVGRQAGDGLGVRPGRRATTCSTTAPATSTATPTRRSTASTTSPAATGRRPRSRPARPPRARRRSTVQFSSAGSSDPDGGALTYSWAFGDGTTSTAANPSKTYTANGTYTATLTVRDPQGATGTASVQIGVGNTAPTVNINAPANGQLFDFGDTIPFHDHRDRPRGRHDQLRPGEDDLRPRARQHGHQITSQTGCSGSITVPVDGEHDAAANIFAIFDAEYTDNGGLTTHKQFTLQPKHRQAEHYKTSSGVAADHQDRRRGRPDGRRHQQRRLDRVRPVQDQ